MMKDMHYQLHKLNAQERQDRAREANRRHEVERENDGPRGKRGRKRQ